MTSLRVLDLCAGAGGLSLGLQRAGFDVTGVELDPDACATHRATVGPCVEASIVGWHPLTMAEPEQFRVVAGGVPCTDHSIAGKRAGTGGTTGALYLELVRIGVEAGADALLLENVVGMRTTRDAEGWATIARVEEAMRRAGYEPRSMVLCAADYGVPQRRYRLFVVAFRDPAHLARWRWPEPTHAETPGLFGLKPWVTVREALDLDGEYERGLPPDVKRNDRGGYPQGVIAVDVEVPSPTIARNPQRIYRKIGAGSNPDLIDRPAPSITVCHDEGRDKTRASRRPRAELARALADARLIDRPSTTINNGARVAVAGHHDSHQSGAVAMSVKDRQILQGFPPDFAFEGTKAAQRRQVGNAVPPPLAEALGRSLAAALRPST